MKVMEYGHRLSTEVIESLSLEIFKNHQDMVLDSYQTKHRGNLVKCNDLRYSGSQAILYDLMVSSDIRFYKNLLIFYIQG